MKVWVFAGGGETEVKGLIPYFLQPHFSSCHFDRKTPIRRKPGPKLNKKYAYGKTGLSLASEIKMRLPEALKYESPCDLILVFDDLDCHAPSERKNLFINTINAISSAQHLKRLVAFAAPEVEAWLIADWDNTIAKHSDFRVCQHNMRHWLQRDKKVPFDAPESYSQLNQTGNGCENKLSEIIVESTVQNDYECKSRYTKSNHTPLLLKDLNIGIVKQKCPLFADWYNMLEQICSLST